MLGELLEHALADAVVTGTRCRGIGHGEALSALWTFCRHGDHLAEFGEILLNGLFEGANAVLGDDLTDHGGGAAARSWRPCRNEGENASPASGPRCSKVSTVNDLVAFCWKISASSATLERDRVGWARGLEYEGEKAATNSMGLF